MKTPKYNLFSLHLKNLFSSHPPTPCSLSFSNFPKTWAPGFWNLPKTWAAGFWNTPAETLSGKVSGVAEQKMQAAAEQKLKDDLTQDFANHFLEDEAGDDEEDEANITLFSGKKRKMSLKSLTSEEKKLRKEKRKEAAQLAAQKTLQADPIDNFLKTMMDPAEIERREKREDQR